MPYSSGFLKDRVTIAKRADDSGNTFGKANHPKYEQLGVFWANASFSKGVKAMHEGAMDAYDTVMFRLRYHGCIDRWCVIKHDGVWYQIQSFHADQHSNEIQITAQEMPNQNIAITNKTIAVG